MNTDEEQNQGKDRNPGPKRAQGSKRSTGKDQLRRLPAVGAVIDALQRRGGRCADADGELLTYLTRRRLDTLRQAVIAGVPIRAQELELAGVTEHVATALERFDGDSSTCRVINATGIILHSGLGRAVLPRPVTDRLAQTRGYVLLEVDREAAVRRKRDAFVEELLCHLTGAEAALVVNNNAAATILLLATLAADKEVIVSRSQMVEIGGSYRLPDVMEASGCQLREVGTTNKSYARDYEAAVNEESGALMLVHTSNYKLVGFTEHVEIEEMVQIGRRVGLPVIHDLGSGCLLSPEALGFDDEPPVQASVKAGADVICFSGDKLIGGVQAGIIVGKRAWVEKVRKHPLARAFRIDKLACIGLETTLKLYLEPSKLRERLPVLRMIRERPETLARRARSLATRLRRELDGRATVGTAATTSEAGSGALPAVGLPTTCVTVRPTEGSVDRLARALRRRPVPIFTRVKDGAVWLDPRTLQTGEAAEIVAAMGDLLV